MNLDLNFFTSDYFDIDVTLEIREKFKSKLLSYYLRPKQFGCDILMYKIIELMLHVVVVKLKSVILLYYPQDLILSKRSMHVLSQNTMLSIKL